MKKTQGKKHKIGTYEIRKISLSCFDDKGFVLHDGLHVKIDSYRWSKNKKRFSQKKKDFTNDQRLTQIKISAYS